MLFLMAILVRLVSVSLLCSVTDVSGTKTVIRKSIATTTVLQNSANVLFRFSVSKF